MAEDQFQPSGGNWWDSAGRNNNNNMRYESGGASQSSSSGITNFAANWQQQQDHHHHVAAAAEHMKARSSMDGSSSVVFHHHHDDPHKLHPPDHSSSSDPNLHMMMGLGLSSPSSLDWDPPSLLRGEKGAENSFRSMLQENLGSSRTNFQQDHHHHQSGTGGMGLSPQQQVQWRDPSSNSNSNSNNNNNRGFSLDQNQFSPQYSSGDSTVTSQQGLHHPSMSSSSSPFQNIDSSALYASPSSIFMQGLLGPDHQSNSNQQANNNNNSLNFPFPSSMSYATDLVPPAPNNSWPNNKLFLRGSASAPPSNNQLHFTNNAPFWNAASEASNSATIKDVRSTGFFPSLQPPFSTTPNFDVQSKNMCEVRDSGGVVKKSGGSEQTAKRPRNETPSPLPAFKVRKEKMGDRITALQQLVSPFGKTDTASVLSEAIEYIKFLHEQVLSTPYMKSGAPIQIQQSSGKSKEPGEGPKQDLRSRGLCLVPVSSTFPVTHETTVDFWTPTFGGGSR